MNKKQLVDLGIAEDVAEKIIVLHGKDIESHKTQVSTLQTQLVEAGSAIEGFKKLDVAGIQKSADDWKTKAEKAQADADAKIAAMRFDSALDSALTGAKVRNAKAVRALLDPTTLKLNEQGVVTDLDRQLADLKKSNDFLFESENAAPRIVTGGQSKTIVADTIVEAARKAAGLPPPK